MDRSVPALRYLLLTLLFVGGLGQRGAVGAEAMSAETQIRQLEQQFIDTIPARGRGMKELLDGNFFYNTSAGSRLTGEMLLNYLATSEMHVLDIAHESLEVDSRHDHAMVEGVVWVRVAHDGALHEQRSRFLHLWRRQPDGWKLSARQVTTISQ